MHRSIDESRNSQAGVIDLVGSVLFGTSLALGIWALIGAQAAGWHSVPTIARFTACVALLIAFVQVEKNRAHAMIDLSLFRQADFVVAVLSMAGYAACAQVMMTFLPLYLQNAFGWSAVSAGVGMLPFDRHDRGALPGSEAFAEVLERCTSVDGTCDYRGGKPVDCVGIHGRTVLAGGGWHDRDRLRRGHAEWRHPKSDHGVRAAESHGHGFRDQHHHEVCSYCEVRGRAGRGAGLADPDGA